MRRAARALLAALPLVGPACGGGGLLPGDAYDRPLLAFTGQIDPPGALAVVTGTSVAVACGDPDQFDLFADGPETAVNPIVGLLWTDPTGNRPDVPAPALSVGSVVSLACDRFRVRVFRPPPLEVFADVPRPLGLAPLHGAFASIVLVDDRDGDGTFSVSGPEATIGDPDRYLGSADTMVAYLDHPGSESNLVTPVATVDRAGFQLVGRICYHETIMTLSEQSPDEGMRMQVQPSSVFPESGACAGNHQP